MAKCVKRLSTAESLWQDSNDPPRRVELVVAVRSYEARHELSGERYRHGIAIYLPRTRHAVLCIFYDQLSKSLSTMASDPEKVQQPFDEKAPKFDEEGDVDSPKSRAQSLDEVRWTEEEEKRLVRKIDCLVMPLLISAFFALQLDRGTSSMFKILDVLYSVLINTLGNIGNALTDNFMEDVGITQGQFNVGQQLLSLGIVLWEIPSNMVLYRIGPSLWLTGQIFAWGFVATFQSFQHGVGPYLATRFLLGTCESGFIRK